MAPCQITVLNFRQEKTKPDQHFHDWMKPLANKRLQKALLIFASKAEISFSEESSTTSKLEIDLMLVCLCCGALKTCIFHIIDLVLFDMYSKSSNNMAMPSH